MSNSKQEYIKRYNSKHYRSVNILFKIDDEKQKQIWEWIHNKYSTAGFIRDLITKEFDKQKKEEN